MGYYIRLKDADFTIPRTNKKNALKDVNEKLEGDYNTLKEAMKKHGRWETKEDSIGSLKIRYFTGEKAGFGEHEILRIIAPHAEEGSYVEMIGEGGEHFKLFVEDGILKEVTGEITYNTDDANNCTFPGELA